MQRNPLWFSGIFSICRFRLFTAICLVITYCVFIWKIHKSWHFIEIRYKTENIIIYGMTWYVKYVFSKNRFLADFPCTPTIYANVSHYHPSCFPEYAPLYQNLWIICIISFSESTENVLVKNKESYKMTISFVQLF